MTSVGKLCIYCRKPIVADDRAAVCDRCFASHHDECWNRNGRCSTFRCAGAARTMVGSDIAVVIASATESANSQPVSCPYCDNTVYAGRLRAIRKDGNHKEAQSGLQFQSKQPKTDGIGGKLMSKLRGGKQWFLPGGQIKSRSCGKCHRLFVWGVVIDDQFVEQAVNDTADRYCPHCSAVLMIGVINIVPESTFGAAFECNDTPDLHKGWFAHNILDRYIYNKWKVAAPSLPVRSCEECQYTELAGRPIYRFL